MKIQQLSPEVVKKLRSGIAFTNVAHCVEELVLNSIDADATCIAVNLNLPLYQIQVIDNGCGIDVKQMKIIGTRYATSKCHSLKDLQNLKSGGFRGEALSSLKEISSVLMIESRTASSSETYCKIFTQGKSLEPKMSHNSRPSKGTSVSVYDFMYNLPVRKKYISDALDLEECRKLLQNIALMYPNISFTLKNEATGEMCLQLKKCSSLYHSFLQIFGKSKAHNLKNVDYQKEHYEITGCISTDSHISKDLQLLYVNKRHVLRTKLHKLINSVINKALNSKQKPNVSVNSLSSDSSGQSNQCHSIFVLNISCPYDKYDVIFEPRKTMIEFSEWNSVLKTVKDALIVFLKSENLYSDINETELSILKSYSGEKAISSNLDVNDCRQGLFSHVVRRLFEPIDLHKDSAAGKSFENLRTNFENHNADVCDVSMHSTPEKEITSEFANKNASTSEDLLQGKRNTKSSYQEFGIFSQNDELHINMPNNYGFTEKATTPKFTESYSPSKSKEVESCIPCRTVFPSENPVMLRVPMKSTLSDLQTSCSSLNFHKLKEKIQCFARKEKTRPLFRSRLDRKSEKVSRRFNDVLNKPFQNQSLDNSPNLCFNAEKYKAKLQEFKHMNFSNKSSQCPSVSHCQKIVKDQYKNNHDAQGKQLSIIRMTEDKSFQCPSVSVDKPAKIFSRFEFRECTVQPLRRLKQSERLQRKSLRKPCNVHFTENFINSINDNKETCVSKRPKSSNDILSGISDFSENNTSEENKSIEGDIEDFSEVRAISEEQVNNFPCKFGMHNVLESFSQSPAMVNISGPKTNELETSLNLQIFMKTKYLENCTQNVQVFTELENNFCLEKDELLSQTHDSLHDKPENQVNDLQSFSPHRQSIEIVSCIKEIGKGVHLSTDSNVDFNYEESIGVCVAESMHMKFETPKEDNSVKNIGVYSKIVPSDLTDVEYDIYNSCSDVNKNNLHNLQNKNCLRDNEIMECVEAESTGFKLQHEVVSNTLASSDVEKSNEPQPDNSVSLLATEVVKSICNVNFQSNPFTESLSLMPENLSSKADDLQKRNSNDNENVSNCLSQELFIESSLSEVPNKDFEVSANNEQTSNDPNVSDTNIVLQPCSSINEGDTVEMLCKDLNCVESKSYSHWKLHLEPESKRKIYVDPVTGNSTYISPKIYEGDVNQMVQSIDDNSIENMLSVWKNPMFDIPYEVTSAADNKISHNVSQMHSFLNSYKFSKSTLNSLQVIGQVDCKFIACILKDCNEDYRDQKLLALFDQHAVHERIRLEELIEDLYVTDKNGEKCVKTSMINPPLQVSFSDEEIRLLQTYHEKLHKIGIHINMDGESHIYSVNSVPSCLVHKESGQLRRSVSDSITILQNAVTEWLSSLVKTRSIPQVLPKTLLSVLNYQACRGAVKFGDPLTFQQCSDLLETLSSCKLPFQCAHGRPSIAPILDLKKIEKLYKKKSPPRLQTLIHQLQE